MLRFRYAANSHVGLVRANNEDSGFAGPYLLLVADGVGGAAAGEIASASTTYVTSAVSMIADDSDPLTILGQTVQYAHAHLQTGVERDPARSGMSTTMTAVLCDGAQFGLAHIGDSRGFRWRDGKLTQITKDHSMVQMLLDSGQITVEEAQVHPHRAVVVRAIDACTTPEPDLQLLDLQLGDRLLLCSDGLSDLVDPRTIEQLVGQPDLDAAVDTLIAAALAAGGRDNITCVLGEVEDGPQVKRYGVMVGSAQSPGNLIDGAAIRVRMSNSVRTAQLQI